MDLAIPGAIFDTLFCYVSPDFGRGGKQRQIFVGDISISVNGGPSAARAPTFDRYFNRHVLHVPSCAHSRARWEACSIDLFTRGLYKGLQRRSRVLYRKSCPCPSCPSLLDRILNRLCPSLGHGGGQEWTRQKTRKGMDSKGPGMEMGGRATGPMAMAVGLAHPGSPTLKPGRHVAIGLGGRIPWHLLFRASSGPHLDPHTSLLLTHPLLLFSLF